MEQSYWKKRRELKKRVDAHMRACALPVQAVACVDSDSHIGQIQNDNWLTHQGSFETQNSLGSADTITSECLLSTGSGSQSRISGSVGEPLEELVLEYCFDQLSGCDDDDHVVDEEDPNNPDTDSDTYSCESGTEIDSDSEGEQLEYSSSELAGWASDFNISHSALGQLLGILRKSNHALPKDPRTLLGTMTNVHPQVVAGGTYHHFGIAASLVKFFSQADLVAPVELVSLQVNIDGMPLFKSSSVQFWPILGRLVLPTASDPFVIGIFCGDKKPTDVHQYFHEFVGEVLALQESGVVLRGFVDPVPLHIQSFICDSPARAFVKQVKGHSGYYGCDKCCQRGLYQDRKVTFPRVDAPLRTDRDFKNRRQPEHHHAVSPLETLRGVGMVSQFPLDFMHLVCLGVMKRLLGLWTRSPVAKNVRISAQSVGRISANIVAVQRFVPVEFARKCRSLQEMERWKATEFRQFLLYSGPVVLKDVLPRAMYVNFLLLFVSIFCLASPALCQIYNEYAHQLLCLFVSRAGPLYGQDIFVYNVHGLVHLAADVKNFGPLDSFSAIPFENFLGGLKKLVRKPNRPLQQVMRRISERGVKPAPKKALDEMCYLVVEFTDSVESEVAIVPESWIDREGRHCMLWPPFRNSDRINKAVKEMWAPESNWTSHPYRELYRNESYKRARSKLAKSVSHTDLNTTDAGTEEETGVRPRGQLKRNSALRRLSSSSDSSGNQSPVTHDAPPAAHPTGSRNGSTAHTTGGQRMPSGSNLTAYAGNSSELPQPPQSPFPLSRRALPGLHSNGGQFRPGQHHHSPNSSNVPSHLDSQYHQGQHLQHHNSPTGRYVPPSNFDSQYHQGQHHNSPTGRYVPPSNIDNGTRLQHIEDRLARSERQNERIFTILEKILQEQADIKRLLGRRGAAVDPDPMPEGIDLPLANVAAVDDLERHLQDPQQELSVIHELSLVGGADVRSTTHACMNKVLHRRLAVTFCWQGTRGDRGKRAFCGLRLKATVTKAVRRTYPKATDHEVKSAIQDWFRGASDRRKQPRQVEEDNA